MGTWGGVFELAESVYPAGALPQPAASSRWLSGMLSGSSSRLNSLASRISRLSGTPSRALAGFNGTVTGRYRALLRRLADDTDELHRHFVAAMISGDLTGLEQMAGRPARSRGVIPK
jgi:hypothetical protein